MMELMLHSPGTSRVDTSPPATSTASGYTTPMHILDMDPMVPAAHSTFQPVPQHRLMED